MKKIIFLMLFGFWGISAQSADIDIPIFGDGQMPTETQKKENADFPLFLPPTAPQNTVNELPFREPLDTKKAVDFSAPKVPVQPLEEGEKQKFLPALPKEKNFKLPDSIPPAMKTGIEIKPVLKKEEVEVKKHPPKTETIKTTPDPRRALDFQFVSDKNDIKQSEKEIKKNEEVETPLQKEVQKPAPSVQKKDVSSTQETTPDKAVVQQTETTKPSLLQKSMALPTEKSKETFLNPFDVEEEISDLDEELPPETAMVERKASPVEDIDILGVYLHMLPQDITDEVQMRGFQVSHVAYGVPTTQTVRLEDECRIKDGVVQFEKLQNCVQEKAKQEDMYYIREIDFKNENTREKLHVKFSSLFTDNKAYYIEYTALGDNSLGTSSKDIAKKMARQELFWDLVFEKYGNPTYKNLMVWGNPDGMSFKAYIEGTALNGKLVLEDKILPQDDMSDAFAHSDASFQTNVFSFAP